MIPIATIASKNYLAHVRVLVQSYLRFHPDGQVFVCLVDQVDGYFDPGAEPFITILADTIAIPHWEHFSFKYTVLELNTAVKPFLLSYLFKTYNLEQLAYLDPDIALYGSLSELDSLLDTYGLVLTPHILEPLNDTASPSEIDLLQSGIYNLGFVALSRRTNLDLLLGWWQNRLYDHCIRDVAHGLFVDQRWMDFAPALFENVYLWRHPGCNVAYWNYAHRPIVTDGDTCTVQGQPLIFMHYSGLMVENLDAVSQHQNRFTLTDLPSGTQSLLRDYRARLLANGYATVREWPYAYGTFANGVSIPDIARAMSRTLVTADQFTKESFYEYLNSPAAKMSTPKTPYLTQLAVHIYNDDFNLQRYLPEGLTNQQTRLMQWFCTEGFRYYQLDSAFLEPMTPGGVPETLRAAVRQQNEIHGWSWKTRFRHVAKTLLGNARYERLRAFYQSLSGFKVW